jgi:polysaccharide biosynthesis/export protein
MVEMSKPAQTLASCVLLAIAVLAGTAQTPSPQPLQPAAPLPSPAVQPELQSDGELDQEWTPWTSGRYRITPGDVLELKFPFVPELDQTLAVHPDGYVTLREVGDVRVQGHTLPELRAEFLRAYAEIVRQPDLTLALKEFEKPYFVVSGQLTRPGRYELRGATTLTQALAYAGGPASGAKLSEVVLFRRFTADTVAVRQVNVKAMYDRRDLSEDPLLRPGDLILVPKSLLGKLAPVMPRVNMGLYINPFDMGR